MSPLFAALPPNPPAIHLAQAPSATPSAPTNMDLAREAVRANELEQAELYVMLWLVGHPDDEEAQFLAGRVASWRNKHQDAVHFLAPLVQRHPNSADYQMALGRAYFYNNDRQTALAHIDRARVLTPNDFEIWLLEIRLLEELGGQNAAVAADLRQRAAKRFPGKPLPAPAKAIGSPESSRMPMRVGREPSDWVSTAAAEYDFLNNGFSPWYGGSLQLARTWTPKQRAWVRLRETNRFDFFDTEFGLGGTLPFFATPLVGGLDLTVSPTNQVLPIYTAIASMGLSLDPISLELRLRGSAYRLAFVPSTTLAADYYFGPLRAGYNLTVTRAPDTSLPLIHTATASWYPNEWHALTLGGSWGDEVQAVAPQKVVSTNTFSLFANGRIGLIEGWSVMPELAYTDQSAFFSRYSAQVAVEKRF